jgi:hypothetical protein
MIKCYSIIKCLPVSPPDPPGLPDNAFDEQGNIKEEFFEKEKYRAYPEGHSVWDKLVK